MKNNGLTNNLKKQLCCISKSYFAKIFLFFSFLIVLIVLMFWPIDVSVKVAGKTIAEGKINIVKSSQNGTVNEIFVKNGDVVKKGEKILSFSPVISKEEELFNLKLRSIDLESILYGTQPNWPSPNNILQAKLIDAKKQDYLENQMNVRLMFSEIKEKIKHKEYALQEINLNYKNNKLKLEISQNYYKKIKTLFNEGIASKVELDQARLDFLNNQNESKRINNKIKSVKYDFDILKDRCVKIYNSLKDEKTKTDNRIINIQTTLSGDANEFLVSPISGLVKDLRVFKTGDPVKINRTVATIIPINNKISVIVDVDAKDIGYIKLGQKAIVDFNKGEPRFYDNGNAKVSKIWTTSPKIYNKKVYYPVKLTLDSNFISIKNNIAMIALAQQIVSVRIITKQESLLKLMFN